MSLHTESQNGWADILGPEWRVAWWQELEATQPEVAARLVRMYPERYPVRGES